MLFVVMYYIQHRCSNHPQCSCAVNACKNANRLTYLLLAHFQSCHPSIQNPLRTRVSLQVSTAFEIWFIFLSNCRSWTKSSLWSIHPSVTILLHSCRKNAGKTQALLVVSNVCHRKFTIIQWFNWQWLSCRNYDRVISIWQKAATGADSGRCRSITRACSEIKSQNFARN